MPSATLTQPKLPLPPLQPLPNSFSSSSNSPTATTIPSSSTSHSSTPLTTAQKHQLLTHRLPPPQSHPFVYAVLTTKIYCLPTCPSRLARRANINFFDTPQQASKQGFRSCKRCKPDLSPWFANSSVSRDDSSKPSTQSPTVTARSIIRVTEDTSTIDTTSHSSLSNPLNLTPPPPSTDPTDINVNVDVYDPTDPALKLHLALQLIHAHVHSQPTSSSSALSQPHSPSHSQTHFQSPTTLNPTSDKPLTLSALSKAVGLSKWHLHRAFKRRMGKTPREIGERLIMLQREKQRCRHEHENRPGTGLQHQGGSEINGSETYNENESGNDNEKMGVENENNEDTSKNERAKEKDTVLEQERQQRYHFPSWETQAPWQACDDDEPQCHSYPCPSSPPSNTLTLSDFFSSSSFTSPSPTLSLSDCLSERGKPPSDSSERTYPLPETPSSYPTTPAPTSISTEREFIDDADDDMVEPFCSSSAFGPDVECILRDLFPEIYDEKNMMII